tara:strand:- start:78316 stop:78693 length:378 start_codon:yes stop_codon:yes gene_type:complete
MFRLLGFAVARFAVRDALCSVARLLGSLCAVWRLPALCVSPEVIVSGGIGAGSKRVYLEAETYDPSISTRNSSRPIPPNGAEHGAEAVSHGARLASRHTSNQSRKPSHPTNFEAYENASESPRNS